MWIKKSLLIRLFFFSHDVLAGYVIPGLPRGHTFSGPSKLLNGKVFVIVNPGVLNERKHWIGFPSNIDFKKYGWGCSIFYSKWSILLSQEDEDAQYQGKGKLRMDVRIAQKFSEHQLSSFDGRGLELGDFSYLGEFSSKSNLEAVFKQQGYVFDNGWLSLSSQQLCFSGNISSVDPFDVSGRTISAVYALVVLDSVILKGQNYKEMYQFARWLSYAGFSSQCVKADEGVWAFYRRKKT